MAFLKRLIDKPTFLMIQSVWTAVVSYVGLTIAPDHPYETALIVTIGNLIISWLALESASSDEQKTTETPSPNP